jgi:hypothetical protein
MIGCHRQTQYFGHNIDTFATVATTTTSNTTKKMMMNQGGLPYRISNAPNYDTGELANLYEYFDVYSLPIRTLYSQVHWTSHGPIPLPSHIVKRFQQQDKVMAVMGYEVNQVRLDPHTGQEDSVPLTWAYNHHYMVVRIITKKKIVMSQEVQYSHIHIPSFSRTKSSFTTADTDMS